MVLDESVKKLLEQAIYDVSPNKVILNGMLSWLNAADDNLGKENLVKIMKRCYSDIEINDAKEILKNVVKANQEIFRNDKEVETMMGGRKEPEKKEKIIQDIVDLNARLDGAGLIPTFLMTSADFKRNPQLLNPEDDIENVSHKVNMLESCILNLANKVAEDNRVLKEEIRSMKPSFADVLRNRDVGAQRVPDRQNSDNIREGIRNRSKSAPKRSRVDGDISEDKDERIHRSESTE